MRGVGSVRGKAGGEHLQGERTTYGELFGVILIIIIIGELRQSGIRESNAEVHTYYMVALFTRREMSHTHRIQNDKVQDNFSR